METITSFAVELNERIESANPIVADLLSSLGKRIYLPKGILSQSSEAAQRANCFNATRAIALENEDVMHLPSSHQLVPEIDPSLVYGYAPTLGQMGLRLRWKARLETDNPSLRGKAFSLPIVTCGLTHGFSLIGDLFVNSNDTLVIPEKFWGNYRLIFQTKCGAKIQTYPFYNERKQFNTTGFCETLKKISHTNGKLIVLINFPHNPTGYAITTEEAAEVTQAITEVAASGCRILVLVDDAYFGLWYDDNALQESIFGWLVDSHPNVLPIKIDGATKEEFAWGLRVGFLTFGLDGEAMEGLEHKMTALIRANTSGASQLSQTLVAKAMDSPQYTLEKSQKYETLKYRALRVRTIAANPQYAHLWDVYPFNAGYFMCIRLKSGNAETVRQQLLDEYGIGVIAIGETDLRVAFSCIEAAEIDELFRAIAQVAMRAAGKR